MDAAVPGSRQLPEETASYLVAHLVVQAGLRQVYKIQRLLRVDIGGEEAIGDVFQRASQLGQKPQHVLAGHGLKMMPHRWHTDVTDTVERPYADVLHPLLDAPGLEGDSGFLRVYLHGVGQDVAAEQDALLPMPAAPTAPRAAVPIFAKDDHQGVVGELALVRRAEDLN